MTKPITAPTQHHLPIADIADDIVLTKDGGAAVVLKTTALNFSLLSDKEQEAVTFAYAALINSLSFPIQILVRSHKKDISNYIAFLDSQAKGQQNSKLRDLMISYKDFVSQIVKKRNVLEKEFFIVIPFSPLELGLSADFLMSLLKPGGHKKIPFSKDYVIKKAKTALYPKRDHLIRQSGRLGIRIQQLTTEDLAILFAKTYTPEEEKVVQGEQVGAGNTEGRKEELKEVKYEPAV
ncbi:MAG: hypothetical protein HYU80_00405 [Candidatus Blackburnbacteria bacterium]|nr:hypothetical protein [Candidatus Blackburnbacteria bacterium]